MIFSHLFIFGFPFCFLFPAVPCCSDIVFSHFHIFLKMFYCYFSFCYHILVKFYSGFPIIKVTFLILHHFPVAVLPVVPVVSVGPRDPSRGISGIHQRRIGETAHGKAIRTQRVRHNGENSNGEMMQNEKCHFYGL